MDPLLRLRAILRDVHSNVTLLAPFMKRDKMSKITKYKYD